MIKITNLSFVKNHTPIFANLNLQVGARETCLISGRSGCGKTSLLRLIAGFETPESGTVMVNGQLFSSKDFILEPQARSIDMLFQDDCLWPGLKISNQLELAASSRRDSANQILFETNNYLKHLVEELKIEHLLERFPEGLSGGEARRCQLARVLINAPPLLLLDEPTAFLDENNAKAVIRLLDKILPQLQCCCLIVSHENEFFGDFILQKHNFYDLLQA